jgi:hypothetical protein
MAPLTVIGNRKELNEFQRLLADREEVKGTWKAYTFTNVFDVISGCQSVRWIYGPGGYCFIQGKINGNEVTVYKVRDNSRMNKILGIEQVAAPNP